MIRKIAVTAFSALSLVATSFKAIVAGALCLLAASSVNAGTLYIGGWDTRTVYSVDLTTQILTPVLTPANSFGRITGMEGIGNELYVFDQTNSQVSRIDPTNGSIILPTYNLAALISTNNAPIGVSGEGTFAMHSNLTGFVSSSSGPVGTYWIFDLNAGTSTRLGTGISFDGIDYAPNGILYGLTQSSTTTGGSALYIIDPTNGSTTLIGSTGITGEALAGLVVAEGDFIGAIGPNLYRIDPITAAATLLFNAGIGDISGAAYLGSTNPPGPNQTPEPATLALLALGLAGLGLRRRRKA